MSFVVNSGNEKVWKDECGQELFPLRVKDSTALGYYPLDRFFRGFRSFSNADYQSVVAIVTKS